MIRTLARKLDEAAKRALDVGMAVAAGGSFVAALPALAAAIRLDTPGPIFFQCARLGRGGKPMRVWKLRTMIHNAPERFNADGSRLVEAADSRVTRMGKILRGGLDELPQCWNVLRGQLSFVGPRPDDLFAVDLYDGTDWLKLAITPGITGLAQVNGRNELPYKERLKYDAWYACNRTLLLDLRILLRTALLAAGVAPSSPLVPIEVAEAFIARPDVRARAHEVESSVRRA